MTPPDFDFRIYSPYDWGARQPKSPITIVGRASLIIFHHTAGHFAQLDDIAGQSLEESFNYARAIQDYHMDSPNTGWIDSGHNFLVCRNGVILGGRWLTINAIKAGQMVRSAHCPGQNDQIGIEHEHKGTEEMTAKQFEAAARLQAWIAWHYGRKAPLPVDPHSEHFATACPANLVEDIPRVRKRAGELLRDWAAV